VVAKSAGLPKVKSNRGIDYIVLRRLHETVRETTALLRSLNFTVAIEHIPGRFNSFADRLSRLHEDITLTVAQIGVSTASSSEPLDIDDVKDIQQADPLITSVIAKLTNDAASMTVAEKGLSYGCYEIILVFANLLKTLIVIYSTLLSSGGGGYQNPTKRYDQPPGPWRTIGLDLF
ncbi:hypothetical protein FOL46_002822, partial [Perkinsus olseni]